MSVVGAIVAYLVYTMALVALQRRLIFPRHYTVPDPSVAEQVPGLERWTVDSPEGPVEAWFLPGDRANDSSPAPAVIFAHGNAELIEDWPLFLAPYQRAGISVLLPEYRGYGRSAGTPSQKAIVDDFAAFRARLAQRPEVDPGGIIYHGRSLGGGVVCALADREAPAALILQSTFTSMGDMARRFLLPRFLVHDRFDNRSVISRLDVPMLIAHCRQDKLIPFSHAERNHAAARGSRLLAYPGDHNDCPPVGVDFWRAVRGFLREAGLGGAG